jgi:PadR family transcriptional regulator PadR
MLVRSEWRIDTEGARPRKYYALTDAGAAALENLLAQWQRINATLNAFLNRKVGP